MRSSENFPFSLLGRLLGKCPYALHSPGAPMPHRDPSPPRLLHREKGMQRGGGARRPAEGNPSSVCHPGWVGCTPLGHVVGSCSFDKAVPRGQVCSSPRGWLARLRRWPAVLHTPGERGSPSQLCVPPGTSWFPPPGSPSLGCVSGGMIELSIR